jgi:CheY-like chemotaxis protein
MATILLVEDDSTLCYALSKTLISAGHRVVAALDGMSALAQLDGPEVIDLLLVDIVMPRGQPHGLAIAQMARRKRPAMAVIFMTGHPDIPRDLLDDPVLPKPLDPNLLLEEVASSLGHTPTGSPVVATSDRETGKASQRRRGPLP